MSEDLVSAIRTAIVGLEYPSESDAPFDMFSWDSSRGELTKEALASVVGKEKKKLPRVQEAAVRDFFRRACGFRGCSSFQEPRSNSVRQSFGLEGVPGRIGQSRYLYRRQNC